MGSHIALQGRKEVHWVSVGHWKLLFTTWPRHLIMIFWTFVVKVMIEMHLRLTQLSLIIVLRYCIRWTLVITLLNFFLLIGFCSVRLAVVSVYFPITSAWCSTYGHIWLLVDHSGWKVRFRTWKSYACVHSAFAFSQVLISFISTTRMYMDRTSRRQHA